MKVGYYQFRPRFGKIRHNLDKVTGVLDGADVELLVLPELAFTGYYFRDRDEVKSLAEDPHKSSTVESLISLCRKNKFYLVTGFAEKAKDKYFNSALLIGPKGIKHIYRKIHLFNEENSWFDRGDIQLQVNKVRNTRIGIMICFDWVFPEVARTLSLHGTDIICHPSNLVLDYCQQTMLTRCLENKVFAITCNRYGYDKRPHGNIRFTGCSQIVAPGGKLIYKSKSQRDDLFIMEIDPSIAKDKNITPMNEVFRDRRPEFYRTLIKKGN